LIVYLFFFVVVTVVAPFIFIYFIHRQWKV